MLESMGRKEVVLYALSNCPAGLQDLPILGGVLGPPPPRLSFSHLAAGCLDSSLYTFCAPAPTSGSSPGPTQAPGLGPSPNPASRTNPLSTPVLHLQVGDDQQVEVSSVTIYTWDPRRVSTITTLPHLRWFVKVGS